MMTLFDDEEILKMYLDSREHDAYRKTAERMLRMGKCTLEEISCYIPEVSIEELREIQDQIIKSTSS